MKASSLGERRVKDPWTILVDADSLVFAAAVKGAESLQACREAFDRRVRRLIREFRTLGDCRFIVSGTIRCFRYSVYSEYKATRKQVAGPPHRRAIREYAIEKYRAEPADNWGPYEADDILGLENGPRVLLAHIDKDIDQVPGRHFNFNRYETYEVTEEQGLNSFFYQMLRGDRSDNIPGIPFVRPASVLKGPTVDDNLTAIENKWAEYLWDQEPCESLQRVLQRNADLLWLPRPGKERYIWRS